jgi:hypothetical protein
VAARAGLRALRRPHGAAGRCVRNIQISRVAGIVDEAATWRTFARAQWSRSHVYCQAPPASVNVNVDTGTLAQHHSTLLVRMLFATGLKQGRLPQMCNFVVLIICDVELSATLTSGACRVIACQQQLRKLACLGVFLLRAFSCSEPLQAMLRTHRALMGGPQACDLDASCWTGLGRVGEQVW